MRVKLTDASEQLCEELLRSCVDTGKDCEAAIACGLDMQQELQVNEEQLQVAKNVLEKFGNNRG